MHVSLPFSGESKVIRAEARAELSAELSGMNGKLSVSVENWINLGNPIPFSSCTLRQRSNPVFFICVKGTCVNLSYSFLE